MSFTDDDRKIARSVIQSEKALDLLERIFTPEQENIELQMENNCLQLSDAEYGQNMKALAIAKALYRTKMATLKSLASEKKPQEGKNAPR